jgi:hypothetical protein
MNRWLLAVLLSGCLVSTAAAQRLDSDSTAFPAAPATNRRLDNTRLWLVGGGNVVGGILLYREVRATWGASNGRFHVKNDWSADGFVQTDEISHLFTGYTLTRTFARMWGWTGMSPKRARTLAAVEAAVVLTLIEVPLDAFNPRQGLGVTDLVFDYMGIALGLLALNHPGRWDLKVSVKQNPFTSQKSLFPREYEADNYIFWAVYRPGGERQPVSVGLGYSARRAEDGLEALREVYVGAGVTVPDLVRAIAPRAARHFGLLSAYYFNVKLRSTVR